MSSMSFPHDAVRVLPIGVDDTGAVTLFGYRWWSEESTQYHHRIVELRISARPHIDAWLFSLKGELLCKVQLIDDHADHRGCRRCASVVGRVPTDIAQLADQATERARLGYEVSGQGRRALPLRIIDHLRRSAGRLAFGNRNVRKAQATGGHHSSLDLEKSPLEHGQSVVGGHRVSNLPERGSTELNEAGVAAHRLCGDGK